MQGDRKGLPYMPRRSQMEGRPLRSPCPLQMVISSRLKIGRLVGFKFIMSIRIKRRIAELVIARRAAGSMTGTSPLTPTHSYNGSVGAMAGTSPVTPTHSSIGVVGAMTGTSPVTPLSRGHCVACHASVYRSDRACPCHADSVMFPTTCFSLMFISTLLHLMHIALSMFI